MRFVRATTRNHPPHLAPTQKPLPKLGLQWLQPKELSVDELLWIPGLAIGGHACDLSFALFF